MKVAIYTRVSTQEQANEGYSITEQKRKLISFCEVHDWNSYEVFTDAGFSGGSTKRPSLQKLFDSLDDYDLVLVYKLDRLTRNVRDLLEMLEVFESKNVSFKSATEVFDTTTAIGKLFITMVGAMAEWERETIRERSLFGSRAAVSEGNYIREAPFCYDNNDGKLVPNQYSKIIDYIVSEFKKGLSANEIAKRLNATNQLPPKIKSWNRVTINRLIRNPVLRGHTKHGDMFIENTHEPVILENDYLTILETLEKRTHKSNTKHHSIFRGVLVCPQCKNRLHLYAGRIKTSNGYQYKVRRCKCDRCSKDKTVQSVSINESEVERVFIETLKGFDLNKFKIDLEPKKVPKIEYDETKIKAQRKKYTRSWSMGYIDDDEYYELMGETQKLLDSIEKEEIQPISNDLSRKQIESVTNLLLKGWQLMSVEEKEEIILSTVKEIHFDYISRKENKNGSTNTIKINRICFKY
ncbi:recombinase family protein [Staphylococcus pseudintermedius]|uniref:recombinase family protein n=1 Tax=Staphylococcus pseudintermedius TaxID=283734 RepID=UPI0028FD356A|nr:recombinase family protein [Staphylococcus pseudintermedius]MDU0381921.1 recombinase family protein [Staphylococcus pseudintermedius]